MTKKAVTLSNVADAAGVSLAAASRALNGKEGVREDVRARIQLVADALGYRPNRAAKNLAGGPAAVLGFVLGADDLSTHRYGAKLLQAVTNAADAHDEGLMLINDAVAPSEKIQNVLRDGLVDGVIVSIVALGESWVEELLDAKVPAVLVGAHPRRSDVCVVDVANRGPVKTLVGHMLDSGCERVATLATSRSMKSWSLPESSLESLDTSWPTKSSPHNPMRSSAETTRWPWGSTAASKNVVCRFQGISPLRASMAPHVTSSAAPDHRCRDTEGARRAKAPTFRAVDRT